MGILPSKLSLGPFSTQVLVVNVFGATGMGPLTLDNERGRAIPWGPMTVAAAHTGPRCPAFVCGYACTRSQTALSIHLTTRMEKT